jgi:hypothetical protein
MLNKPRALRVIYLTSIWYCRISGESSMCRRMSNSAVECAALSCDVNREQQQQRRVQTRARWGAKQVNNSRKVHDT